MCDPATIAMTTLAVSSASAVAGFAGQQQASAANKTAANIGYGQNYNALQERSTQIDEAQSENTFDAIVSRAAASGRISNTAAAFGTDQATTTQQQNASDFGIGRDASVDDLNYENQRIQVSQGVTNADLQRQSQINRVPKPSVAALGLTLAGDAASAGGTYLNLGGNVPASMKLGGGSKLLGSNVADGGVRV